MSPSDKQLQHLSLALKGADCGLWDWNIATGEASFDSSFFLISGYEPDEFPHHFDEWRKRVHPQDFGPIEREIQKYLSGEIKTFAIEFRFKRKSGDWMWILGKGEVTEWDEAGNPVRFMGLHIDINEKN